MCVAVASTVQVISGRTSVLHSSSMGKLHIIFVIYDRLLTLSKCSNRSGIKMLGDYLESQKYYSFRIYPSINLALSAI
jgi:hypothetical protein